ncbi:MAG: 4'-phosphopantetheinyl transferase family protein [Mangrovibacterium sp.]
MPLLKTITIQDGILLFWELTEPVSSLTTMFPEAMTDPVFKQITSYKRQQEWLVIRALLKAAGCNPKQLTYSQTGQPCIDHPDYLGISISHSDKLAGLFLHRMYPVGLDIENSNRNFIRVEKKYLSPEERLLASTIPKGHGLFWCIKEAMYKAAGIPGILFAEQIRISLNQANKLTAELIPDDEHSFLMNSFEIGEQLIVYVIAEERH